jgi:hypothetical protein
MAQAKRVHSTPPTSTPIDTTRRHLLTAAAAGGVVAAAVPPPRSRQTIPTLKSLPRGRRMSTVIEFPEPIRYHGERDRQSSRRSIPGSGERDW